MRFEDRLIYHEIHPAKVAIDLGSGLFSLILLWRGHAPAGLFVVSIPPALASAALIAFADLETQRRSPFGRYVRRTQTVRVHGLRLAGFGAMMLAAWIRSPLLMVAGLLAVILCWSYGLLLPRRA